MSRARFLLVPLAFALASGASTAARAQGEEAPAAPPTPPPATTEAPPATAPVGDSVEKPLPKPKVAPKKEPPKDAAAAAATKDAGKDTKGKKKGDKEKPEPPAPPAPPPEVVEKAEKLRHEVNALLVAEPGDSHALENVAQSAPSDVAAADPALRAMLKLARARSLTIQSRYDEAASSLQEARGLIDGVGLMAREQRRLTGEVRYQAAELDEVKTAKTALASCGPLGLQRVAALEGRDVRGRVDTLSDRFKHAVQAGDRFWGRRAAFHVAVLYDDLYRYAIKHAQPGALRGVTLPSPFAVHDIDTKAVVAEVLGGAWPVEISRLYSELIASIDAREPDDVLLAQARKKAADFARLEIPDGEKVTNPWVKDEKPGLVRYNHRFEKKGVDGAWAAIDAKVAKPILLENAKKPIGTVEQAYALAALAEAGPAPSTEDILANMASDDERAELAGLVAAEKSPDPAMLEPLVEIANKPTKGEPFATLQGALFGTRERALLALRALAGRDRETAQKILDDTKIPARERAWAVAELGDGRLEYSLQYLAGNSEPAVSATALYGLYLSAGKNALGYLRPNDTGVVGCVSRAVQIIDAEGH